MFISLIVPIYNTKSYLPKCINSLLTQNMKKNEYEIICVDDGSTDGCQQLLDEYASRYENIIVISQQNKGVCEARNAGIRVARGDYIWFIDSDDYIEKDCLLQIEKASKNSSIERIVFGNCYFPDDINNAEVENNNSEKAFMYNTSWYDSVVWRSVFKKDFIINNNLFFHHPELAYGEDAIYMYEIKRKQPSCTVLEDYFYYHRGRAGSAGTETDDLAEQIKKLESNLQESLIMKKYYDEGDRFPDTANRLMVFLWGTIYRIANLDRKKANDYIDVLRKNGMYPFATISGCTITTSGQTFGNHKIIQKVFDTIYVRSNSVLGYHSLRLFIRVLKSISKVRAK